MTHGRFECERCGYSRFHRAREFKDGRPEDTTRICRDCGWREGEPTGWEYDERNTVERESYGTPAAA